MAFAQQPPAAQAPSFKTAEQQFKNIKVLTGRNGYRQREGSFQRTKRSSTARLEEARKEGAPIFRSGKTTVINTDYHAHAL